MFLTYSPFLTVLSSRSCVGDFIVYVTTFHSYKKIVRHAPAGERRCETCQHCKRMTGGGLRRTKQERREEKRRLVGKVVIIK